MARKLYNFMIDHDLAKALKVLKERDGVAESESVRRALREYLQQKRVMKTDRARTGPRRSSRG
jgi:hypothetical protein